MSSDTPRELPPYRAVLVVDTKGFGSNNDVVQAAIADTIHDVVARAFERAGLAHVLEGALFPHNTGDGFGMGFETRYLPAVVSLFFDALQTELAEQNARMRSRPGRASLRMRASLNVGPVRDVDPEGNASVVGTTVVTAHRLLDAEPVRRVLTGSDPEQTFVSAVLSQRVFEDVLASGYATVAVSRVAEVPVRVKEFTGTVYLYVPNPSGDLLRDGFGSNPEYREKLAAAEVEREREARSSRATRNIIRGGTHSGPTIQVGHLHGGLNQR
ncbi:hypothetical protein [Umezawaea sp. NPDC059074]|uniref:hypothetical protein n=1 Tax=Umezawaea sp. NPDC059074 TaxID=3346716 RepID=UPI0036ACAAB6